MSRRVFALSVAPLLGGCGLLTPGIVGDWALDEWTVDGDRIELSYSYGAYDVKYSMDMSVDDDLEVDMKFNLRVTGGDANDSYSVTFSGDAEKAGKNEWDISVESDDDLDMDLTCVLEDDVLECDGEDSDGTEHEMVFEADD